MNSSKPICQKSILVTLLACIGATIGCGPGSSRATVKIDGSSTVYPVTEAVAVAFREVQPEVRVSVGVSGTGGGFERFVRGEIDICDASRKIDDVEIARLQENEIKYVELVIAYDGLAVVTHPANDWADCLTVAQLEQIWQPDSEINMWSDLVSDWPDQSISLYGPGQDSGTFDYFTTAILGKSGRSRSDYSPSEDDNVLVSGISEDRYSLGYFGFAYYAENTQKLKLLGVDNGNGCIKPSDETVLSGSYSPLSRPLFMYVRHSSFSRPEVRDFVQFYIENASELVKDIGYVPVSDEQHAMNLAAIRDATR